MFNSLKNTPAQVVRAMTETEKLVFKLEQLQKSRSRSRGVGNRSRLRSRG
jgi:hypothetical protein